MKRIGSRIAVTAALLSLAAMASAGPISFQIGGSDLDILALGAGDYTYYDASMASPAWLEEGDSFTFTFGFVDVDPFVAALGLAELTVQLLSPTADGTLNDFATFAIGAAFDFGAATLSWLDPVMIGYSYAGASGGLLSLNMFDMDGFYHDGFYLSGRITNVRSPVQVTEPGLLLLLGSGLLTMAAVRRRKARA